MIPEDEFIARFKNGDKEVFDIVYKRYFSKIYSFIKYRFNINGENAKDVTQDIMIKAYESLDKLKDNRKFRSWLFRIAHNHCINHKKRKNDYIPIDEERVINLMPEPDNEFIQKENLKIFRKCLEKLPEKYRVILHLFYYEELKLREIKYIIGCSLETVQKRKAKGLGLLKGYLDDNDFIDA